MNSVKRKLLLSYLVIIGLVIIFSTISISINFYLVEQYEHVNTNIVETQALNNEASGLVSDAYIGFQTNNYTKYNQRLNRVRIAEENLDARFSDNQDSMIAYRGVKNSLEFVIRNISDTKEKLKEKQDLGSISSFYKENSALYDYVTQSITDLILRETANLSKVNEQTEKIKTNLTYLNIISVMLGSISLIIFAIVFSTKLTQPLIKLASMAGQIGPDNLEFNAEEKMLKRNDEIGSLFRAFKNMVDQVRVKVEKINESNLELEKATKETEKSLKDVEKLNTLMIGRELKMIELKKEITRLKERLGENA